MTTWVAELALGIAVRPSRDATAPLYALGMMKAEGSSGRRLVLLVSKSAEPLFAHLGGGAHAIAEVLEPAGAEPGFAPPSVRRADAHGRILLQPYAVALVSVGD